MPESSALTGQINRLISILEGQSMQLIRMGETFKQTNTLLRELSTQLENINHRLFHIEGGIGVRHHVAPSRNPTF